MSRNHLNYVEDCAGLGTASQSPCEVIKQDGLRLQATGLIASETHHGLSKFLKSNGCFRKVLPNAEKTITCSRKYGKKQCSQKRRALLVYTCGFQCHSFSKQGCHLGLKDKRSETMKYAAAFMSKSRPDVFILENVKIFSMTRHMQSRSKLMRSLPKKKRYKLFEKVFCSSKYGGAQLRQRWYLVGVKKHLKLARTFQWPLEKKKGQRLKQFLNLTTNPKDVDFENYTQRRNWKLMEDLPLTKHTDQPGPWVVDLGASEAFGTKVAFDSCPCITRTGGGGK